MVRAVTLDPACRPAVRKSAATIQTIVAEDRTVYGVNTGFGKLASTRIAKADLETLQRNLVLSHATGTGAPLPDHIVRLVMAMKAASLATRLFRHQRGDPRPPPGHARPGRAAGHS